MPQTSAEIRHGLASLSEAYNSDAVLSSRAEADPRTVLAEYGLDVPEELDVRIVSNTSEIEHIVFPPNPNSELSDEALSLVVGGGSWGTLSCPISTASSTGSMPEQMPSGTTS